MDDSTFVIHQGKQVHVEQPFLYLLLGTEAARLHDELVVEQRRTVRTGGADGRRPRALAIPLIE
jgi:hypothetical protein